MWRGCINFFEERLRDFVERLRDFFLGCVIFVVERLCDSVGGCVIFFGG